MALGGFLQDVQAYLVLASLIALFVLLAKSRAHPAKWMVGLAMGYYLAGLVTLNGFLTSYVNPAVMTLMLLLLVGMVLEKTTWLNRLAEGLFKPSLRVTYAKMGLFVGLSSAFLNNTAIVASLLSAAKNNRFQLPSKVLIPLSYIAILGGTLTLVGTSTHLLVNGLLVQAGFTPFALLDFIWVGLPVLVIGSLVIVLLAGRLLPTIGRESTSQRDYFIEAHISPNSVFIGQSIKQAGLRNLQSLFLVELIRDGQLISPVSPDTVLMAKDRLLFAGDGDGANQLKTLPGLTLPGLVESLDTDNLVEVVISPQSSVVDLTLKQANFRNKFDAAVVAINRGGETLSGKLGEIALQAGDKLLLATGHDFNQRENLAKNFYFLSERKLFKPLSSMQSHLTLVAFLAVLGLNVAGVLALFDGLLILLGLFLAFGFLGVKEVRHRMPFDLFLMIGSALVIASVLLSSGAANLISHAIMHLFGQWGVIGAFVGVYLLTLLMTETVTNNAAAALAFPVAIATAQGLDVSVLPFVLAVAYGASASFLTPFGYQTNLMVYTPGQYRFVDYVRMGMPVSLVYSATVLILTPLFFPF